MADPVSAGIALAAGGLGAVMSSGNSGGPSMAGAPSAPAVAEAPQGAKPKAMPKQRSLVGLGDTDPGTGGGPNPGKTLIGQ